MILKGPAAGEAFRFISVDVGSSIALAMVSKLALGSALLEGHRMILDPLAFGAWFGTVITALNLLPIGQLDGGYISHAIFGARRANVLSIVGLIAVFLLTFFVWSGLLMWAFVIFFIASTRDLLPANDLTRIGLGRTAVGYFSFGAPPFNSSSSARLFLSSIEDSSLYVGDSGRFPRFQILLTYTCTGYMYN